MNIVPDCLIWKWLHYTHLCVCVCANGHADVQLCILMFVCRGQKWVSNVSVSLPHTFWARFRVSLNLELTNRLLLTASKPQVSFSLCPGSKSSAPQDWDCKCTPPCWPFLRSGGDPTQVFMLMQQALHPLICHSNLWECLISKIAICTLCFAVQHIDWLVQLF